tara:strand:+ start:553 stop:732 length:180 start_codon:yes stop_codon:yes gene_type:complete
MSGWYFTLIFVFSLLVISKNIFNFILKLIASEPTEYILSEKELIFLGVCISYSITYLIY